MTAKKWGIGASKALLVGTMAAGLCLGMTAAAFAQDDEDEVEQLSPRPSRVRLIGAYLSNHDVKDILGAPILGVGVSYDFKRLETTLPINLAVTLDYVGKTRTKNRQKVSASYFGVGVAPRVYFLPDGSKLNFYAGGGAFLSFPYYKVTISGTEESQDNTITIGGKLFSGVEFDRSFFGEFEYIFPGKSQLNSFNAAIGYRF